MCAIVNRYNVWFCISTVSVYRQIHTKNKNAVEVLSIVNALMFTLLFKPFACFLYKDMRVFDVFMLKSSVGRSGHYKPN